MTQVGCGLGVFPAEAMDNPRYGRLQLFMQGQQFINSFHYVDNERLACCLGQRRLVSEYFLLKGERGGCQFVKPRFSDSQYLRMTENGFKRRTEGVIVPYVLVHVPGMKSYRIPAFRLWLESIGQAVFNSLSRRVRQTVRMDVNRIGHIYNRYRIQGTGSYPEPPHG